MPDHNTWAIKGTATLSGEGSAAIPANSKSVNTHLTVAPANAGREGSATSMVRYFGAGWIVLQHQVVGTPVVSQRLFPRWAREWTDFLTGHESDYAWLLAPGWTVVVEFRG